MGRLPTRGAETKEGVKAMIHAKGTHRYERRHGAVAVEAAAAITALLGFAALPVDIGLRHNPGRLLSPTADAAATTGPSEMQSGECRTWLNRRGSSTRSAGSDQWSCSDDGRLENNRPSAEQKQALGQPEVAPSAVVAAGASHPLG